MSVEILMKIPGVDGEALTKGHEKEIELGSFSMGASNPSGVSAGSGSGAGKVDISSLSIQKSVDLSSAKLFQQCCAGKHFDTATIVCREAGGDAPVDYWTIKLKQVYIDNVSWGASSGGGKPSESVSVSFAEISFDYYSQDDKGAKKDKVSGGWNVKQNAAAAS
jgi:type VI secretion system secreted protein Hcp